MTTDGEGVEAGEFFDAAGLFDLLFHPQERFFTLLELRDMLDEANLASDAVLRVVEDVLGLVRA